MATNNSWSSGVIAKMKSLFDRGMSTAEIGKRLGFSKNAIVGKINRLGWNMPVKKASSSVASQSKKKSPKIQPRKPAKKAALPKKSAATSAREARQSKKNIEMMIRHSAQLMGLRADQCRWPIGDPDSENFRFCGGKCFTGKPYCFEHCKVAYQFATPVKMPVKRK